MLKRIALFDRARGLAILLMVFANTTPVLGLDYVGPFWLRALCSIPAPLFVLIAGMMVAKTASYQPALHYIKRGAAILILAAAINVFIHQSPPFQNIEILYLLGLGIPLVYLINYLNTLFIISLCLLIFILTAILQFYFPFELALIKTYSKWQLWFVNGWFPFFPWVGIMSVGLVFYRLYEKNNLFKPHGIWIAMSGFLILGIVLLCFFTNMPITPYGYQELFYPPTLIFICIAIPTAWLMLFFLNKINSKNLPPLNFIAMLGKHSLFIYTLHLFFIFWVIGPYFYPLQSIPVFLGIYVLHISILVLITYLLSSTLQKIK